MSEGDDARADGTNDARADDTSDTRADDTSDARVGHASVRRRVPTLAALSVLLAALIVSPLAREGVADSFPISRYPMFARGDLGHVLALSHALLVGADGARRPAPPAIVGTPEPMIATAIVRANVERGTAPVLCAAIAGRARAAAMDATAVEIVTSSFDTQRYFSGTPDARTPLHRDVHARCVVGP